MTGDLTQEAPERLVPATCAPDFDHDPYPTWNAWREAAPVQWSDEFLDGAWVVTRHADVAALLRDPRFSAQRTGGWLAAKEDDGRDAKRAAFRRLFARAMLFLDDPDHSRIRRTLQRAFSPSAMRALTDHAEQIATTMCEGLDIDGGFDFMTQVARPLPAAIIARWMGLEGVDRETFMGWSDALAAFIGAMQPTARQTQAAQDGLAAMAQALESVLEARRAAPGDDLVSALIRGESDGSLRTGPELVAQCAMLLFAGYETSRNLLGNGLNALLRDRKAWERLRAEPALLPGAVRELLRFDSPVQYTARRVTTDLTFHGRLLRRGDLVVAALAAANRDPRVFERPDELDVARHGAASLAFGAGAHFCIGAALTQIEAQAVFRTLLRRCPTLAATDPTPQWSGNTVYRGLKTLHVRAIRAH